MNSPDWDRTRMDLHPADPLPEPGYAEPAVEEEVADPRLRRIRVVRIINAIINFVCGLFAVVLALHIVLVLGNANPHNGFASFVDSWSSAVSLGLRNLFTPDSLKLRVLFNDGLAAIVWLVIGAVLTYLIRQFALPGPRTSVQYRRRFVR
jgi:hypothetical protein